MSLVIDEALRARLVKLCEEADQAFRKDVSYAVALAEQGHMQLAQDEAFHRHYKAALTRLRETATREPVPPDVAERRARKRARERARLAARSEEQIVSDRAREAERMRLRRARERGES